MTDPTAGTPVRPAPRLRTNSFQEDSGDTKQKKSVFNTPSTVWTTLFGKSDDRPLNWDNTYEDLKFSGQHSVDNLGTVANASITKNIPYLNDIKDGDVDSNNLDKVNKTWGDRAKEIFVVGASLVLLVGIVLPVAVIVSIVFAVGYVCLAILTGPYHLGRKLWDSNYELPNDLFTVSFVARGTQSRRRRVS
jgi:hypothetical protein